MGPLASPPRKAVVCSLVLIFLLGITQGIHSRHAKEPDLSILANVLQKLFKTYTHSLRESPNYDIVTDKPLQLEPTVEKIINTKITELKPFLQDNDDFKNEIQEYNYASTHDKIKELAKKLHDEDDNITLEGDEETTIIEFHPNHNTPKSSIRINNEKPVEFKNNIIKYKIIRDRIKSALIEESVSFQTRKLVTNTLDDMLANMVRSQCPANSILDDTLQNHNSLRSKTIARTSKDLAINWTNQWHAIRDKYNRIWKENFSQQSHPARKLFMFFEQIQEFLTHIEKDTQHISNNYKVVCKLVKKDEVNIKNLNLGNLRTSADREKYNCPTFKICSDELRQFMGRFYNNLNDTAVSTFKNYAAMYNTDVNSDGSGEKESAIENINKIGNYTEQIIGKIFKKRTETFGIDQNKDRNENIRILRSYVIDTIGACLHAIRSNINSEIVSLRTRLIENLKQDMKANIKIDLENLAAELNDGICRHFSSCNSRIMRRSFDYFDNKIEARVHKPVDNNKVYVKLKMNFDKKLKEDIARGNIDFLDYAFWPIKNAAREKSIAATQRKDVTRTTQPDNSTQANTPEKPFNKENLDKGPKKQFVLKNDMYEFFSKKPIIEWASNSMHHQADTLGRNLKKHKHEKNSKKLKFEKNSEIKDSESNSEAEKSRKEKSENNSEAEESKKEKSINSLDSEVTETSVEKDIKFTRLVHEVSTEILQ